LVLENLLLYNIPCTVASVFSLVCYLIMLSVELMTGWVINMEQLVEWELAGETAVLWLYKKDADSGQDSLKHDRK
jgi:hypothetical protein